MTALLLVDLQNDFLPGGALGVKDGDSILPVINKLLKHPFDLIIGSKDWHPADHVSFADSHGKKINDVIEVNGRRQALWPKHCVQGTHGAEYSDRWDHSKIKKEFHKGTQKNLDSYTAFFDDGVSRSTGLQEYLQSKGIKDLYIAGLTTEYCVKATALDALKLGYNVYVVLDGCKPINVQPDDEEQAVKEMLQAGASLIYSNELS
jgi:nicotinamidase/pyrazinamidase